MCDTGSYAVAGAFLLCFSDQDSAIDRVTAFAILSKTRICSRITQTRPSNFELTDAQAPAHFIFRVVDDLNLVFEPANCGTGHSLYRARQRSRVAHCQFAIVQWHRELRLGVVVVFLINGLFIRYHFLFNDGKV